MSDLGQDRAAITRLVESYASLVDARAYDAVADLFAADAVLVLPDPPSCLGPVREIAGREAVLVELGRLGAFDRTEHLVRQAEVRVSDDGVATGTILGEAHHVRRHEGVLRDLVWVLHYEDAYRRAEDAWRFVRRAVHIDAIESRRIE